MNYISQVSIKDYLCIKELELNLSPLHAFIGPNDSGKSTILKAVRTLFDVASAKLPEAGWTVGAVRTRVALEALHDHCRRGRTCTGLRHYWSSHPER